MNETQTVKAVFICHYYLIWFLDVHLLRKLKH